MSNTITVSLRKFLSPEQISVLALFCEVAATLWDISDRLVEAITYYRRCLKLYSIAYHHSLSADKLTTGILLIDSDVDQSFCFARPVNLVFKYVGDMIVIITVIILSNST